jgi:hypothetical protein
MNPAATLPGNLDSIAVWIEHPAFIVPVSGAARPIQNGMPSVLELPGQLVNTRLRTDADGQMREPHSLRAGLERHRMAWQRVVMYRNATKSPFCV